MCFKQFFLIKLQVTVLAQEDIPRCYRVAVLNWLRLRNGRRGWGGRLRLWPELRARTALMWQEPFEVCEYAVALVTLDVNWSRLELKCEGRSHIHSFFLFLGKVDNYGCLFHWEDIFSIVLFFHLFPTKSCLFWDVGKMITFYQQLPNWPRLSSIQVIVKKNTVVANF